MTSRLVRAPFLLLLLGVSCAIPSRRENPLTGLGMQSGPYARVKLGVIVSQNTKNWVRSFNKLATLSPSFKGKGDEQLDRLVDAVRKQFGFVSELYSLDQARQAGVDLVCVLDVSGQARVSFLPKSELDVALMFFTTDEKPVDTIRFQVVSPPRGGGLFDDKYTKAYNGAVALATAKMAELIPQSEKVTAQVAAMSETAPTTPAPASVISDVDLPVYSRAEDHKRFALVIGIESYQSLPKAPFAERDAESVRRHLLAMGYPERNVIHLVGARATVSGLKKYLEEWLPLNIRPDSTLFVYFSGHGAPDPTTGEAYLVPWDGDASFLKTTAYPLKSFYERLVKTKARRVLVALDACFSGVGGRSVLAAGARPLVTKVDISASGFGLTLLAAASGDQITTTLPEQGHGIFTYYLLKGLNGAAGSSGALTPQALYSYLKPKVQDAARRQNREQTPVLRSDGDWPLR